MTEQSPTGPARERDELALPTNRGRPRVLEPAIDPHSARGMALWKARVRSGRKPLCVSLWSGAGGLDLGLEQAGYDVAVAVDHDEWSCQTHAYNSRALVACRDLSDPEDVSRYLGSLELPQVALVAGGFPCQPYSRAGHSIIRHLVRQERREAVDERAFAWQSFVSAVEALRPDRALVENVPDIARYSEGRLLRDIVTSLENLGYEVDVRVLSARAHGVPQYRERLFIQAAKEGPIAWPEPEDGSESATTVRHAIGDLPEVEAGSSEDPTAYNPAGGLEAPPWAKDGEEGSHAGFVFDHVARAVREDDLAAYRQLQEGGTYLDVPEELRRYDDQHFTDKYKRLEWDKPSRTVTAHMARDGYWYIHPDQHRTLTIREAARLQTFPDSYLFAGHPSNRYKQIGNAVPPLLARAVGSAMLRPNEHLVSRVPEAAALLAEAAASAGRAKTPWEIILEEVVLGGRAGPSRVNELAAALPTPESAARADGPAGGHARQAEQLARAVREEFAGDVPGDPDELARLPGMTAAAARLVAALAAGGAPPATAATRRLAERVSGVRREGSLSGVVNVALARLSTFGDDPATNQYLVELARQTCRNADPACDRCPLRPACDYGAGVPAGDQLMLAEPAAAATA